MKEQFLNAYPEKIGDIPELLADLQNYEDTRSGYFYHLTTHNFANDEIARRMIDLTSPGGYVRNSNVEEYIHLSTFVHNEERAMNDTSASTILHQNGWHFKVSILKVYLESIWILIELYRTIPSTVRVEKFLYRLLMTKHFLLLL